MSIQDELIEIQGDKELLTAEMVVAWARAHPKSELHKAPQFHGWDKDKLAYEQLLQGARQIIALHVVYEDGTRRLVSLSVDRAREGGGYRKVDDVLRSKSLHEIMLADALRELERMEAKYTAITDLKPVWRETSKVRERFSKRKGEGSGKAA